jgi:hypothetical protein
MKKLKEIGMMYLKAQLNNLKKKHAFSYGSNSNVIHAT